MVHKERRDLELIASRPRSDNDHSMRGQKSGLYQTPTGVILELLSPQRTPMLRCPLNASVVPRFLALETRRTTGDLLLRRRAVTRHQPACQPASAGDFVGGRVSQEPARRGGSGQA